MTIPLLNQSHCRPSRRHARLGYCAWSVARAKSVVEIAQTERPPRGGPPKPIGYFDQAAIGSSLLSLAAPAKPTQQADAGESRKFIDELQRDGGGVSVMIHRSIDPSGKIVFTVPWVWSNVADGSFLA
jgi:hypothetical protein